MLSRHMRFMKFLEREAWQHTRFAGSRIMAMVAMGKEPISVGFNCFKTSPFQAKFGKNNESIYFHAEVHAIHKAIRSLGLEGKSDDQIAEVLKHATLYVCRVKYENSNKTVRLWGLAKPCDGCWEAIRTYKIKRVIYSLDGDRHVGIWER